MPAFATASDFATFIQRDLTAEDTATAEYLLNQSTAAVVSYTGQKFSVVANDITRVKVDRGKVRLPQAPVTAVTAVKDTNGNPVTFTWHIGQTIDVSTQVPDSWAWEPYRNGLQYVDVTYTHGYAAIPPDVVAVVLQMAARAFGSPGAESGMQQESITNYSYQMGGAAASGPVGMLAGERATLDRYRRAGGPIRMLA